MVFLAETVSGSLWTGGETRSSWTHMCSFVMVVQFIKQGSGFAQRKWPESRFIPGSSFQTCIFTSTKFLHASCYLRLILLARNLKCFFKWNQYIFPF